MIASRHLFYFSLIFCVLLTGCGLHLRQACSLPPEIQTLYFEADNPNSPLTIQLRDTLQSLAVQFVLHPKDSPITLHLGTIQTHQTYPSISTASLATTYTLSLSLLVSLTNPQGELILPSKLFSVSHNIILSANQVLLPNIDIASNRELQREASILIYYWLTSENVKIALQEYMASPLHHRKKVH
jgi:LPS-assembly lipoprotein